MGTYCSRLDETHDPCDISGCVESVKGLESNSSSPTDTWILTFKDGTSYKNIQIKEAFMKLFVDTRNVMYDKAIDGLYYEMTMYRNHIRPLIDTDICPYFIRYLSNSESCSYVDMMKILVKGIPDDMAKQMNYNFTRNIKYMLLGENGRPSINSNVPGNINQDISFDITKLKFGFLMNQLPKGSNTLLNVYNQTLSISDRELAIIIYQVFIGCYAMELSKIAHNDLHPGNVFIEILDHPVVIEYLIEHEGDVINCKFETKYVPRIYDFDRAYAVNMGNNPVLYEYEDYSQNNYVANAKDMYKIGVIFRHKFEDLFRQTLGQVFVSNIKTRKMLRDVTPYLQYPSGALPEEMYNTKFHKSFNILKNLSQNSPNIQFSAKKNSDYVYVLSSRMFNDNGTIKSDYETIRENILNSRGNIYDTIESCEKRVKELEEKIARLEAGITDQELNVMYKEISE